MIDYRTMSNVQQTSLEAWQEKISDPVELGRQQRQVLDAFIGHTLLNDKQLSLLTGLPINVITPRRGELVKLGLLEADCEGVCPITRKKSIFWRESLLPYKKEKN